MSVRVPSFGQRFILKYLLPEKILPAIRPAFVDVLQTAGCKVRDYSEADALPFGFFPDLAGPGVRRFVVIYPVIRLGSLVLLRDRAVVEYAHDMNWSPAAHGTKPNWIWIQYNASASRALIPSGVLLGVGVVSVAVWVPSAWLSLAVASMIGLALAVFAPLWLGCNRRVGTSIMAAIMRAVGPNPRPVLFEVDRSDLKG